MWFGWRGVVWCGVVCAVARCSVVWCGVVENVCGGV